MQNGGLTRCEKKEEGVQTKTRKTEKGRTNTHDIWAGYGEKKNSAAVELTGEKGGDGEGRAG